MSQVPEPVRETIIKLYNEGQEYKRKWNNLTIKKIAEKWEVDIDTLKAAAEGNNKLRGDTLIEESDRPIIRELISDSYRYKREFDKRSPKAISKELGISLGKIRNVIRSQQKEY